MDLLFKEDGFSAQFKSALGFVDSDIKFVKIKPDLMVATRNLIEIIGEPTYIGIVANSISTDSKDTTLDEFAKNAVAISAYVLHAPVNDLAHTPNGRRMRSSGDEKTPFEWMVEKDNDNLQRRSNRAIDTLIKYMDESFDVWKESEVYAKSFNSYIRSVAEFNPFYLLESRYLLLKLTSAINRCEKRLILPRIGKELNTQLKLERKTPPDEENVFNQELTRLIQEVCAFYSLSWALPRLQLNLFPDGILQSYRGDRNTIGARKVPEGMQIDQTSQLFKEDYEKALIEIEAMVKDPEPIDEITTTNTYGFEDEDPFVNT